jgi:hypothetical protein
MLPFDFIQYGTYTPRTDRHRILGQVNIDDVPGKCLVCVFDNTTYVLLAAKFSDPTTGQFEFKGMLEYPIKSLLVIGNDLTGLRNSISFNFISQTN